MSFLIDRYETPVPDDFIRRIYEMWGQVPEDVGIGQDITRLRDQLSNRVRTEDRKLLYVATVDGEIAGTSMIWVSRRDPKLCEFGLPATAPRFRRRGIGQALFDRPVEDFRAMGGEAIFLGTNQVPAERVYRRAGYSKLVGAIAQVKILSGDSPEAYFVDYFRGLGPATVHPGDPSDRTPSVPLVHSPHDWQVMDCNAPALSKRYFTHRSFAGQCGRFIDMLDSPGSTFFAARAGDRHKVVGLSTARMLDDGVCSVDAFTHRYYQDSWHELIEAAMAWGRKRGATRLQTTLSVEDYAKRDLFEGLGFRPAGPGGEFFLDGFFLGDCPEGKPVAAVKMLLPAVGNR